MENKLNNLTPFEKDLLLHWFLHHMEMNQRYDLMENFPKIYFKMTGVKAKIWKEENANERNDYAE